MTDAVERAVHALRSTRPMDETVRRRTADALESLVERIRRLEGNMDPPTGEPKRPD